MKKIFILLLSLIFFNQQCYAVTLSEALIQAYNNNLELNAERENIKISEQDLKISRSGFLPSLIYTGSKSQEETSKLTNNNDIELTVNDADPLTHSIIIEQTLIDFGKSADLSKNKIGIDIAKAKLFKKEQEILLKAAEAYTGLIFAKKKLKINQSNLQLLERQVETDQARLERGQITLVDLAQSEASLAGAQANFIQSENEITTSKLNYENVIGKIIDIDLLEDTNNKTFDTPKNLNSAIENSKKNNPDLIIAKLEYKQSDKDITIARSNLSPSATLSFENSRSENFSSTYNERDKNILKATIKWPIYSGGKNIASLSKSRSLKNKKKLLFDSAVKTNNTNVASAWSSFQSSIGLLVSVRLQVKAAEIANEGITIEYESGLGRSTLDVIQSNSILLNSKINLADIERTHLLSQLNLLKAVGFLKSNHLKIQ